MLMWIGVILRASMICEFNISHRVAICIKLPRLVIRSFTPCSLPQLGIGAISLRVRDWSVVLICKIGVTH